MISSHSEEPVAHFNIANLNKSAEEFLPYKKARPDLNLQAIDLKFAQIVGLISLREAVANFNIAETLIFSPLSILSG